MVRRCGTVPFRATEHPQLISYVSHAREIKPLLKYAYSVKGKFIVQAQISPSYLNCKTDTLKLCLTEQQQLFLSFLKNIYLHINICESFRLIQWILLCAYPSVHLFLRGNWKLFLLSCSAFIKTYWKRKGLQIGTQGQTSAIPSAKIWQFGS